MKAYNKTYSILAITFELKKFNRILKFKNSDWKCVKVIGGYIWDLIMQEIDIWISQRPRKVEEKILITFHSLNEVQKWKAFRVTSLTVYLSSCLVTDNLASKLSKNLNVYEVYEKHHNIIPRLFLNANSCVGISLWH